jgi:DNA adenine methylase
MGGKYRLAPWIIKHFPPHDNYIEPFGGMASVLLRKIPSLHEIYNDVNQYVVNLFRVLQDPKLSEQLIRKIDLTPYARDELALAIEKKDDEDPLIKAWSFLVRCNFTIGAKEKGTKLHSFDTRCVNQPGSPGYLIRKNLEKHTVTTCWRNYPEKIWPIIDRFKNVIIESLDGIELIKKYGKHRDNNTLVYCDPPYLAKTRKCPDKNYRHEMSENDHIDLADAIKSTKMMFIVSGYQSELYDRLYEGWETRTKLAMIEMSQYVTEKIWISPNIIKQISLF